MENVIIQFNFEDVFDSNVNIMVVGRWKFGFKIDAWSGEIRRNANYWQLVVRGSKLCRIRTIRTRTWATLTAIGNGWIWATSVHSQVHSDSRNTQTTRTKRSTSRDKIMMTKVSNFEINDFLWMYHCLFFPPRFLSINDYFWTFEQKYETCQRNCRNWISNWEFEGWKFSLKILVGSTPKKIPRLY